MILKLPEKREVYDCIEKKDLGRIETIREDLPEPGMTKIYRLK